MRHFALGTVRAASNVPSHTKKCWNHRSRDNREPRSRRSPPQRVSRFRLESHAGAPAELAEMCDYLQIFVSDDEALDYVVRQLSPGLTPRHIVLAHSTVAPHSMIAAAEIVERRGARFIEAPFTGSKEAAEKGELVYYLGGDAAAIVEARPVLEATSRQVMEIGTVGQATAIKLATNMVTAASIQAAAEALALVQSAGLPLEKFAAAMQGNASNSTTLSMKLPKMISGNFEPHFSVKHMLKDMQIASRLGLTHHLELGVSSAARDRLLEQMQRGYGDEDYSAVVRKYFPDVTPAPSAQDDMDLFEPRVPEPTAQPNMMPIQNEIGGFAQPSAVSAAENPAGGLFPVSEVMAEPIISKDPAPASSGFVALAEQSPAFAEDLAEEPEQPRGFISRLLRRGTT
jgi:3-hydroxyisobutyrate dehydrogenase-like beta-hydroxyacid dehydrogenase